MRACVVNGFPLLSEARDEKRSISRKLEQGFPNELIFRFMFGVFLK